MLSRIVYAWGPSTEQPIEDVRDTESEEPAANQGDRERSDH
jgi:hypothetical protein